jgi:hypothetical protein
MEKTVCRVADFICPFMRFTPKADLTGAQLAAPRAKG